MAFKNIKKRGNANFRFTNQHINLNHRDFSGKIPIIFSPKNPSNRGIFQSIVYIFQATHLLIKINLNNYNANQNATFQVSKLLYISWYCKDLDNLGPKNENIL